MAPARRAAFGIVLLGNVGDAVSGAQGVLAEDGQRPVAAGGHRRAVADQAELGDALQGAQAHQGRGVGGAENAGFADGDMQAGAVFHRQADGAAQALQGGDGAQHPARFPQRAAAKRRASDLRRE